MNTGPSDPLGSDRKMFSAFFIGRRPLGSKPEVERASK